MTFDMTRCTRLAALLLPVFALLTPATVGAAEDAILLIDQISGVAGVQRDGKRLALQPGDALQEQDLIVTDRSGRMTLRLGRHGFVEVGPSAEVGVERLPFATYARDLKSIFSVSKGYFRVVWKHPQTSTNWPLFIYMAGHRVSLTSGEYFFQNMGADQRACVAAGQLALQPAGSESLETIKPPSCVQLDAGKPPQTTPRSPDDWIAVRRAYSIEATAASLLAREPSAPAPAAVTPPRPIINTAPAVVAAVTPSPTAIPSNDLLADAEPSVSTSASAAARAGDGSAPVRAAPVIAPPVAAPRTAVAPALPSSPVLAVAPIVIGQVRALPAAGPAASAAAKPAAASDGVWALNIASYSQRDVAEREAVQLRVAGFSAITQPVTISGKVWHRVQISGFASEGAARGAAAELKASRGLQNIWVLKL